MFLFIKKKFSKNENFWILQEIMISFYRSVALPEIIISFYQSVALSEIIISFYRFIPLPTLNSYPFTSNLFFFS